MSTEYMLSTSDNPYNYFTHFDEWLAWDREKGYNTLELLAKVAATSPELPSQLEHQAIDDAIETIVTDYVPGLYIKVASPSDNKS